MAVSEQVILTLLEDSDSLSVAEAMRLILAQYPKPEEFVACHQDDENPQVRRHVQQLSRLLLREGAFRDLVLGVRSRKLSFWDGILLVGDLSDSRVNKAYLQRLFDDFAESVVSGFDRDSRGTTSQMVAALRESMLYVGRGAEFFEIGSLLLYEALQTGQCHPLLLCEIVRQIGQRVGWFSSIMIYGGMYLLRTPDDILLSPENDWNKASVTSDQCRPCADHEMLSTYLALLQVMSVTSHRPIGVYNFSKLLCEIHHVDMERLPFPLGGRRMVPPKRAQGQARESSPGGAPA